MHTWTIANNIQKDRCCASVTRKCSHTSNEEGKIAQLHRIE